MDLKKSVLTIVSNQSGVKVEKILLSHELKKQPLTFDSYGLIYLAEALRAFVKQHTNNKKTVKKREISKSEFKVSDVIQLVKNKIE
jgi:hypothetical protein